MNTIAQTSLFAVSKRAPILPQLLENLRHLRVVNPGETGIPSVSWYLDMDGAALERYIDTLETALVPLSPLPDLASSWMLCAVESELPPDTEIVRAAADLMRELGAVSGWLRDSLELALGERQQRAEKPQHPYYQPATGGQ